MKNLKLFALALLWIGSATTTFAQPHAAGYVRPHSEVEANKPTTDVAVETGAYTADWNNLAAWECPEWFRDAKFGIWAHWDPQCEAEDGDWYARSMYGTGNQRTTFYNYFGHYPDHDWGYKDFCRYWTIANWDPKALIDLYYAAGARYFMAMGQHHDNYDCWDSPYQEWNSMNIGPKRDVVGEWAAECRRVGMKLGVSMHGAHAWTFFEVGRDADTYVKKEEGTDTWWEGYDPQELYAQNHDHSSNWADWGTIHNQWDWGNGVCPPTIAYMQKFQNRILQCINKYDPDMLYFDDTVLPFYGASTNTNDQYSLRILQHFYNHSAAKNGGQQQVVVTGKKLNDTHKKAMLWDIERGTPDRCQDLPWQTCTCLGGWHYSKYEGDRNMYKSAETVVRMLIDIVSKNGNLLLSVPVRGDGTIDNNERNIVNGIKAWMDINSESIHGTRPWKIFGEGPAAEATYDMNGQGFNEGQTYTSSDVRYVTKNGKVYATIMAWPAAGDYRFKAFGITSQFYSGTVTGVKLLGAGDVPFTFDGNGLTVQVPSTKPNSIAPVFEITLGDTSPAAELSTLIPYVKAVKDAVHVGNNSGNYTQAAVDALAAAIATAENVTSGNEASAVAALRTAFANFEANGQVPGGNLDVVGTSLTTDKLIEASNFSATNMGSRFGTPVNWTVENFSIPTGNGTKNGIDNYPGYNCLMIGRWAGEDGTTTSDLTNSRIYRRISLPAGHYFFGASYNANYQLGNAYIFVASSLLPTADVPSQAIAYHSVNQDEINSNYYGVEFYLDTDQEIYLGWQVDLTSGSTTSEFRAQSVELLDLAVVPAILDAQALPMLFNDDQSSFLGETSAFADNGETTRFRSPKNWIVENYAITDGGNGTKKGIDRDPGYNCLQLGRWTESASNYDGVDIANSRLYKEVTLPAGTYYFGAKYHEKCGNCDDNVYMFASKTLVNTADINNVLAGCRLKNATTNGGFWGFTFTLDSEQTLYLGWQANSVPDYTQFRVSEVTLRKEGTDQGVLTDPWTQETAAVPANTGNYFFVLKDYPQDLIMVSKAGVNQGGSNKTMWYTAGVDPSTNKDALWVFDTDGEYQIITSATYPDVMFQTDGQWNYRTQNNGGGDLSWGRAKFALTENGWTVQNGRYGGENYLGPWDGEGAFANNKEVAMNKSGAAIGHFDLFSIPRGLYVKSFEDVASASAEHPVDLTYIVSNPGAERYNNNKVYSWVNGSDWNAKNDDKFDGIVGSRYFELQTSADGDAATVVSDIYQKFTDLPAGYYRFSAVALGGENLQLYANDIAVTAPTGSSARVNVIAQVTTAGTLRIGARAYNDTDEGAKFDDVKLEYLYKRAPMATIGVPTWSVNDGEYVQAVSTVTVSYPDATNSSGKPFAVVDAGKKVTVAVDGGTPAEQAVSLSDNTITISLGGEITPGHTYTITLPAGAVGFEGLKVNDETSVTFYSPKVFDGTYFLYNAKTGKYLAPSGGEVHVTEKGYPVVWQVDNAGNSSIKYWNRSDYVTGRWWAENGSSIKYYIEDAETGFDGFKIRKTNPEDNPWYYLYVSGERVATNGRHTSTGDGNFNDWAYAHWQFIPSYERTTTTGNFGTICLPYEAAPFGATIYSISSITANNLSLAPIADDAWMVAGQPYLFQATADNPQYLMRGEAVTAPVATTGLVGTFTEITAPQGAGYFVLNGNKLYNVDYDGVTVGENRAYIDITAVPSSDVKGSVTLELVGFDPTGIEEIVKGEGSKVKGTAYDLTGRKVANGLLPRGIYIVDGKKVIVK